MSFHETTIDHGIILSDADIRSAHTHERPGLFLTIGRPGNSDKTTTDEPAPSRFAGLDADAVAGAVVVGLPDEPRSRKSTWRDAARAANATTRDNVKVLAEEHATELAAAQNRIAELERQLVEAKRALDGAEGRVTSVIADRDRIVQQRVKIARLSEALTGFIPRITRMMLDLRPLFDGEPGRVKAVYGNDSEVIAFEATDGKFTFQLSLEDNKLTVTPVGDGQVEPLELELSLDGEISRVGLLALTSFLASMPDESLRAIMPERIAKEHFKEIDFREQLLKEMTDYFGSAPANLGFGLGWGAPVTEDSDPDLDLSAFGPIDLSGSMNGSGKVCPIHGIVH